MTAQIDNPKLTITLTGRRPITITKDTWPILASAEEKEHDGQVECQANKISKWKLIVRQHEDGRTIVYGIYTYDSNWQNARCFGVRGGELIPNGDATPEAIQRIGKWMSEQEQPEEDKGRWQTIINDCIADLPAEEV